MKPIWTLLGITEEEKRKRKKAPAPRVERIGHKVHEAPKLPRNAPVDPSTACLLGYMAALEAEQKSRQVPAPTPVKRPVATAVPGSREYDAVQSMQQQLRPNLSGWGRPVPGQVTRLTADQVVAKFVGPKVAAAQVERERRPRQANSNDSGLVPRMVWKPF